VSMALRGARSLKEKRKTLRSVKDRLKNRFNVSIAEVDGHDALQRATLGVCVVSSDAPHADSQLRKALDFISGEVDVYSVDIELINT